jgi:hypothetical protein
MAFLRTILIKLDYFINQYIKEVIIERINEKAMKANKPFRFMAGISNHLL